MQKINWKIIFWDFIKFIFYSIILYALAYTMMRTYVYWSLNSYVTDLSSDISSTESPDFHAVFASYKWLGQTTGYYTFFLVCFGVFFTQPPKDLKHVVITAALISLIADMPFLYDSLQKWLLNISLLFSNILLAWLCAKIWFHYRQNLRPKNLQ